MAEICSHLKKPGPRQATNLITKWFLYESSNLELRGIWGAQFKEQHDTLFWTHELPSVAYKFTFPCSPKALATFSMMPIFSAGNVNHLFFNIERRSQRIMALLRFMLVLQKNCLECIKIYVCFHNCPAENESIYFNDATVKSQLTLLCTRIFLLHLINTVTCVYHFLERKRTLYTRSWEYFPFSAVLICSLGHLFRNKFITFGK